MSLHNKVFYTLLVGYTLSYGAVWADTALENSQVELQKSLNEQVLSNPFSVEDDSKLEAYIKDATERGKPPQSTPSKYWRRGYTCGDLRRYSWADYRDCSYYYRYYGRYWPY